MKKQYLVSEDKFSGQVVIVCESYEEEVDVYVPTEIEMLANRYLYRELPQQMEMKTFYRVTVYYHFESATEKSKLFCHTAETKEEANELFKQALLFAK